MTDALTKLREKLCRELAQSEHDAVLHCAREAQRYGARPPAQAMCDISDHARALRPQLEAMWGADQPVGVRAGRAVGEVFSAVRHFAVDWAIDAERSYRATLLGVRHGMGVAQLLRAVLARQRDERGERLCTTWLDGRSRVIARAEDVLAWFADHPTIALRSSRRSMAGKRAVPPAQACADPEAH